MKLAAIASHNLMFFSLHSVFYHNTRQRRRKRNVITTHTLHKYYFSFDFFVISWFRHFPKLQRVRRKQNFHSSKFSRHNSSFQMNFPDEKCEHSPSRVLTIIPNHDRTFRYSITGVPNYSFWRIFRSYNEFSKPFCITSTSLFYLSKDRKSKMFQN